jgi:molybdopterin-biosynthesis enzyme MoeA-like protein
MSASLGEDFSRSDISLDSGHVRHLFGEHSDTLKEISKNNQLPITQDDINHIGRAFDNPDSIGWREGTDSEGNPIFRIIKRVDDVYYVVGGVRKGDGRNNEISIDTFYKSKKNPRLAGDANFVSPDSTSNDGQAPLGSFDSNVNPNGEVVNTDFSMSEDPELAEYRARRDAIIDSQGKGKNLQEMVDNLNQIRAMDAEMAETHPEWFRDGKFVGNEVKHDFSNEWEDISTENAPEENVKVPEEIPEENTEAPETTDIPEETRNRLKMNLQFFAELTQEKERLKLKLTEKGVKLSERRAINDRIANIDEQLTNFRKTITNTAVKAGIVTMEDIENDPELSKIVNYVVHHNADIVERARQNLSENSEQIKNEYVSGKTEIKTDQDADQAMMLLKGEYGELSNYERNAILKNLAEHGTEAGQFIQSLSKYSNTKEGALISAAKVMSDEVKYWTSRNKRAVGINGKLATALKMQGYDGTIDLTKPKPTFDELRQQIRNTLAEEYSSIENQFTDSDVDYLAHMIEHNATIEDLTEALNTKMATGKFGISDETQAEINRLFDYAKQFDEDSMEYVEAQAEAFRLLAEEVAPRATPLEKFDAWRYIAMLGNPKTMLRNFIGNKMFSAITGVSNNLAAILEAGADATVKGGKFVSNKILGTDFDTSKGIQRTKTAINPISDRALLKATKADAYNKKGRQIEGSKYEKMDKDTLRKNRSVFDSDVMKLVEKAVDRGISDTKAVVSSILHLWQGT